MSSVYFYLNEGESFVPKKIFIILTLLIILVIAFISFVVYSLNNSVPEASPDIIFYTEDRVINYLIEEKGYSKEDILTVKSQREPKNSDLTSAGYTVEVVFSDEPSTRYLYQVKEEEVYQFGISGPAKRHLDLTE